jgi:IS605 OrfB family transposase
MDNLDLIDASLIESATNKAKQVKVSSRTTIFGGKHNWKKFISGIITKDSWKTQRNLPLQFKGRKNKSEKGNRKFKLKVIEENSVYFCPSRDLKFKLDLPALKKGYKEKLFLLQRLCEQGECSFTCSVSTSHVSISFEEEILRTGKYDFIENRILSIDLNPNYLGIVVADYTQNNSKKVIHKEIVSIKELNDLEKNSNKNLNSKRNFECFEISKRISDLASHYKVESLVVEKLNMRSRNHGIGKRYNRLLNNQWNRQKFLDNLKKRCCIIGIRIQEVVPEYSSFIGCMENFGEIDSIASALELGRRGNLFIRKFKKKQNIKTGIVFPKFNPCSLANQWNERLGVKIGGFKTWIGLYKFIKKSKKSVRFLFSPELWEGSSFRLKSEKSLVSIYLGVRLE